MQKTEHYQLNQWDKTDRIQMEDFNADNAKIEVALNEVKELSLFAAKVHFGTYEGNNTETRDITLGFTPKALILTTSYAMFRDASNGCYGGIAAPDYPCTAYSGNSIQIIDNGFRAYYNSDRKAFTNVSGYTYYYIAVE